MAKDFGDRFPSDAGDIKPPAPTVDFVERNTRRIGTRSRRAGRQNTGFDENLYIQQSFSDVRHSFPCTIIENHGNDYYTVMLQDGEEVMAYDPYRIPGYSYVEAQEATILLGPRGNEYILVGQKFFTDTYVGWAELTEILEVGGEAKANITWMRSDGTWYQGGEEITLYDDMAMNYGLIDEPFCFCYDQFSMKAIPVGSQGLDRLGKSTELINVGNFGDVQIHDGGGAVDGAIVEAHLTWAHSSINLQSDKEVILHFYPDREKWIIIGREC